MRHHSRARARRALSVAAGLAVAIAGLASVSPASANPAGTGLVINEVYANGGSAGATYTNKYVELANPTGADIPLSGLSLQYRPATNTGNASTAVALVGTVPAHGFFVVGRQQRHQRRPRPERRPVGDRPERRSGRRDPVRGERDDRHQPRDRLGHHRCGRPGRVGHLQHLRDLGVAGGQRHDRAEPQRHGVRQRHQRDGLQRAGADPGRGQRHHHAATPADRVLHRRDPGHRQRYLAPRRRDRDHPGRRDRRLRHRRVQRLLPPDRRHRRPRPTPRPAPPTRSSCSARPPRRRCTSATSSRCRAR